MKIISILFSGAFLFFCFSIANPYRINGECMEPVIKDGKLYFVNHLYYKINAYRAGDIVIFRQKDKVWISRIVALENQEIKISDHAILIDEAVYSDNIQRSWQDWRYGKYGVDNITKVPLEHVYVLSDNLSAHHDDSRIFGPISYHNILGKVW
ncbi:MAG: signal peptidase I [Chthoniobacterales bacterium]|nr:signal peptidase I [Chthoniobacterales bacterium]